ncbi:motility associated factor glycosyltransferase family protein [Brassicibacter mesophilus]|uniref:motility associated factor glycosyltransferase family protein n=1 Tax=Brassicibacter mesophilus TaxID=745119 RepID=UPI003D190729
MLLVDNITILKNVYPLVWGKIKDVEDSLDENLVKIETTKNGQKTLTIKKEDKLVYLHSKYNPLREAETIVEEYKDIEEGTSVLFYGIGLGYHIDAFLEKHPNMNYYIYEPVTEILYAYLSNKEIKDIPSKKLKGMITGSDKIDIAGFLNEFIAKSDGKVLMVSLPIHKQVFTEYYKEFLDLYKEVAKNKRASTLTEYAYQKRWIKNSMKNFKEVLSSPNLILERKGHFKGKTALLVAAGPSLNEEIENIRYIKENGLAYIFSVGSAINTLIHHNVYPDVACTYDPTEKNQIVFEKVKKLGITNIPLIFGTSVGYETLQNYPGKKCHMITSQDTVARFYLKAKDNEKIVSLFDAPSIAVVTLQLLYYLGFDTIILVGQNLAYKDKKRHSEGIDYSTDVTEKETEKGIWIKDVYGNEVLTDEGFNRMRRQIELYLKEFNGVNVINTTKGGASIEGTTFIELAEVIKERLKESIVEENWLSSEKTSYDKEYLLSQSKRMDRDFKQATKIIKEYYSILDSIDTFIKNRNFNQAEKMYIKLDKSLSKIEKNKFFQTFILPMNRVRYKILADSIDSLNEEKDSTLKGKRIVNSFKEFIDSCKNDVDDIEPIYEEMREVISEASINN